jgi:hypothetical protein
LNSNIHNLSLQGVSGIIFGIFSLFFIYFIKFLLSNFSSATLGIGYLPISFFEILLVITTLLYIFISFLIITQINKKRRKKQHLEGWSFKAKKIRNLYLFFLLIGGIIVYFLVYFGNLKLIIPSSLFIYGISCFLANKYTLGPSAFLGFLVFISAFLALIFPNLMFYIWGLAFGVFHIIYGILDTSKN